MDVLEDTKERKLDGRQATSARVREDEADDALFVSFIYRLVTRRVNEEKYARHNLLMFGGLLPKYFLMVNSEITRVL